MPHNSINPSASPSPPPSLQVGTFCLLLFACLSGCGLHLLARSSMTVSAAAKRKEDAKVEEAEEAGVMGRTGEEGMSKSPPPSSFRAVALVGAPRYTTKSV